MSWLNSQEKLTLLLVEKRILGILFCKKSIALLHLLHIAIVFWGVNYCILQYSIALLASIAIAIAIVLMAIANALVWPVILNFSSKIKGHIKVCQKTRSKILKYIQSTHSTTLHSKVMSHYF